PAPPPRHGRRRRRRRDQAPPPPSALRRQEQLEARAETVGRLEPDVAAEGARELLRDREAEPRTLAVAGEERPEDALALLGRDPRPRVPHGHGHRPVLLVERQLDRSAVGR